MSLRPQKQHAHAPDVSFDGGDLDCGNGLLLLIRKHIDPMSPGQLLEILSTESSVEEDLPAWCRLTGNQLVSFTKSGKQRSFIISKGAFDARSDHLASLSKKELDERNVHPATPEIKTVSIPDALPAPIAAPPVRPLSVMGIGSWPRSGWMLRSLTDYLEGRLDREQFDATADDAVRLAVQAQLDAGVDVITDGEQRRDNYASFIGSVVDNCQLVPLVDLFALVDDPEKFKTELKSLDVPADKVRHPVVFGPIGLSNNLTVRDARLLRSLTDKPVKMTLPGPYLLSRIMWLDCIVDKAYRDRESLAADIVRILREETHALLAQGVSIVQLDEPVLTEVVFSGSKNQRSFMCGALSESGSADEELRFATKLINQVCQGLERERLAVHVCRGNWTADESVALSGDYSALLPVLTNINVGTLFLEFCTERAGSIDVLKQLPRSMRVGVGLVNQKKQQLETVDEIVARAKLAIAVLGEDRVLLNPDCGFATFADSPVASQQIAQAKLSGLVQAAARLRSAGL